MGREDERKAQSEEDRNIERAVERERGSAEKSKEKDGKSDLKRAKTKQANKNKKHRTGEKMKIE